MSITAYICVPDARRAIDWYATAFAARTTYDPVVMPDGRIGHAEITIGDDGVVMMSEPHPELNVDAPEPGRGAAVTLHLEVPDVDAVVHAAVSAGGILDRGPETTEHGRIAVLRDPFGHRWMLNAPVTA